MNYIPWILLAAVSLAWLGSTIYVNEPKNASEGKAYAVSDEDAWAIFEEAELLEKLKESGRPYLPFLNNETMSCGIYRLESGVEDGQQPHKMDEVYYTLAGKAKFEADGDKMEVKPGTILFVAAHADHRFYDIEEDLELLVFFSKVPVGEKE